MNNIRQTLSTMCVLRGHERVLATFISYSRLRKRCLTWSRFCRNYPSRTSERCAYKRLPLVHWERTADRLEWTFSSSVRHWDSQAKEKSNTSIGGTKERNRFIIRTMTKHREHVSEHGENCLSMVSSSIDLNQEPAEVVARLEVNWREMLRTNSISQSRAQTVVS